MEITVDGQVKNTQDIEIVPTPSISLNTPPKQTALVIHFHTTHIHINNMYRWTR